jgi:hypothetical protein
MAPNPKIDLAGRYPPIPELVGNAKIIIETPPILTGAQSAAVDDGAGSIGDRSFNN